MTDKENSADYWGAEATAKRMFEFAKNLCRQRATSTQILSRTLL
ncbi:MAG: hypothetical protein ACLTZI_13790 [[Eubacterium] siraeum]